jgi:hypothetical protein
MKQQEAISLPDSFDRREHFVVASNRHVADNLTAVVDIYFWKVS